MNFSLPKLKAFLDIFDFYYVLKRGEKEDSRDLYLILEKLLKQKSQDQTYKIAYSKHPDGIVNEMTKGRPLVDPAIAVRDSEVFDWLKYLWTEIESKFKNISDAFRQFNITKTSKINFKDFIFIIDFLCIRFSKQQTREMFDQLDSDCDGKLTYQDFYNLKDMIDKGSKTFEFNINESGTPKEDPFS